MYEALISNLREHAEWAHANEWESPSRKRPAPAGKGGRHMTVESNLFDKEEIYPDCTVQVLTNTLTGETSVGWWPNDNPPRVASDRQKETP